MKGRNKTVFVAFGSEVKNGGTCFGGKRKF